MKLAFTVSSTPALRLRVDTERTAVQLADEMWKHWSASFKAGKQPGGEALPKNKEGEPLGLGGGYLVRSWRTRVVARRKGRTSTQVRPADSGRRVIAINALRKRGVRFQGLDGASGEKWQAIVQRITKIMVATAIANSGKSKRK